MKATSNCDCHIWGNTKACLIHVWEVLFVFVFEFEFACVFVCAGNFYFLPESLWPTSFSNGLFVYSAWNSPTNDSFRVIELLLPLPLPLLLLVSTVAITYCCAKCCPHCSNKYVFLDLFIHNNWTFLCYFRSLPFVDAQHNTTQQYTPTSAQTYVVETHNLWNRS